MRYYDFLDKAPGIPALVVVGGSEPVLADAAVDRIVSRLLPPEAQPMNLERLVAVEIADVQRVRESLAAMPFLAETRVVVIRDCHQLKAEARRELWSVAEETPAGSTVVLVDLEISTGRGGKRPESFVKLAPRSALVIDTTTRGEDRERFARELMAELGASAEPPAIRALAQLPDLAEIRSDGEKLALLGRKITAKDVAAETLTPAEAKSWTFADALLEGRTKEALAMAYELLQEDPRAGTALCGALAGAYLSTWTIARGERLTGRLAWKQRTLAPIARKLGVEKAKLGHDHAVRAFEALITGRYEDARQLITVLAATLPKA
ncbi:MAG TPA: hypothetical protein VNJ51_04895 [Candidatus Dormibacteraeota bacterium]|nr:hypothetical protein [Candidatus Dormibacteraeota bacterium]